MEEGMTSDMGGKVNLAGTVNCEEGLHCLHVGSGKGSLVCCRCGAVVMQEITLEGWLRDPEIERY